MEYWQGYMNWPLQKDWKCEICGKRGLIWGLAHAQCRCDNCHTEYYMRDNDKDTTLDVPKCMLKPEYKLAFLKIYQETPMKIEDIPDELWDRQMA